MTAWAQSLRMRPVPSGAHGRLFALLRTMQATPPAGAAVAALTIAHGTLVTVVAIAVAMGLPAVVLAHDLMSAATDADTTARPGNDSAPVAGPAAPPERGYP